MGKVSLEYKLVSDTRSPLYGMFIKALVEDYTNAKGRKASYWKSRFQNTSFNLIAGVIVLNDSRIVGLLGCIERVDGICGLSVWWVEEAYRNKSIGLLSFVLRSLGDDVPIVNSSANPTASKVFERLKGWRKTEEFLGIPYFSPAFPRRNNVVIRPRIGLVIDKQGGLLYLILQMIRHRKLVLSLSHSSKGLFFVKSIVVYYKNIEFTEECISHYGDRYE